MTKSILMAAAMLFLSATASAQVAFDMTKVTCDQFRSFQIGDPMHIATWLDGYYSGKRDSTVIDIQKFEENYKKLQNYCLLNDKVTIFQAAQTLFGVPK